MAGAGSDRKTRYYLLENYFLRQSTQLERLNEFMSQGFLPAAGKIHGGPKIFLEAQVAAHVPQFVCVLGLESLEELATIRARLREDPGYQKAFAAWEYGPEPPYEHFANLEATGCPAPAVRRAGDQDLSPLRHPSYSVYRDGGRRQHAEPHISHSF